MTHSDDLQPGYWYADQAAKYLNCTERKISMYRRHGLLKWARFGKHYVYRREWLDAFAEYWAGYDLSNENAVAFAIKSKKWELKHGK